MKFKALATGLAVAAALGATTVMANEPYVVRGNTHMLIGVKLNADAVREMIPEGLTPVEGMTGGLQMYESGGSDTVEGYKRSYVWVDLVDMNSVTGNPGRYILWVADSDKSQKMAKLGYDRADGEVALSEADGLMTGTLSVDGTQLVEASVKPGDCADGTGAINYPSQMKDVDGLSVTVYAFAGKFCGAELDSLDVTAPEDHPLSRLDPQPAGWAAVARELSFSATPAMALPKKE